MNLRVRVFEKSDSSPSRDSISPSPEACPDYATTRECFNLISFILIPKFSNFKIGVVGLKKLGDGAMKLGGGAKKLGGGAKKLGGGAEPHLAQPWLRH